MRHTTDIRWFFEQLSTVQADRTALLAVPHNTVTVIVCDDEVFDHNDEYNPVTGYFTATATGYYLIQCHATWDLAATAPGRLYLQATDELNNLWSQSVEYAAVADLITMHINIIRYITTGKDVRFKAFQTTGGGANIMGGSGYTCFHVERVPVL